MIEAAFMTGLLPGPWAAWEFVGAASLRDGGTTTVDALFPAGIQPGDLVVATMSPSSEAGRTVMTADGWQHLTPGPQDYLCTARYAAGLEAPVYVREGRNSIFVSVLVFRAKGWTTVKLEAHVSPATPLTVSTRRQNVLLLAIGITPRSTQSWTGSMTGAKPTARVERESTPAMQVYSANVDLPHQVTEIMVDAPQGSERNMVLSVS